MPSALLGGASGFLGSAIAGWLQEQGYRTSRLVRGASSGEGRVAWDPESGHVDREAIARCAPDLVINLAGQPIAQRWTDDRRRRIRDSRVRGTRALAEAVSSLRKAQSLLINGSAISFYGAHCGDQWLDESAPCGDDFLARVADEWERATEPATRAGVRVVMLRTGLVLSKHGGVLARLLPPFQMGVGGRLGDGRQWMSWIAVEDYVRALAFTISRVAIAGAVNVVAPEPVRNDEFTETLGRVLSRPALLPVPRAGLMLLFGEMADNTILASQRVTPKKLAGAGFEFRRPHLDEALRAALRR
ncbi:MAG TPA: TIGR01777 family oxidoreductase [Gemmatimonadaceae bacterium]